jgi:hypothetical protein
MSSFEGVCQDKDTSSGVSWFQVNVDEAEHGVMQTAKAYALPLYQFYFDGVLLDSFSGGNPDKLRLMARNCVQQRLEILQQREKEEAERAAAAAAEAAAAAAAAENE